MNRRYTNRCYVYLYLLCLSLLDAGFVFLFYNFGEVSLCVRYIRRKLIILHYVNGPIYFDSVNNRLINDACATSGLSVWLDKNIFPALKD